MSLPLMDLPEGKGPFKFIMQWHYRGRSIHTDFRLEVDDHLIGMTLDDPGGVGKKQRLSNDPKYSTYHKILSQVKARQPKEWMTIKGEIPPGSVGATRYLPAKFVVIDQGTYDMGTQKPYMMEVFLYGKKYQGRFIARKLPRSGGWERAGKEALVWFFWKPMDQNPYLLSSRGIYKQFVPPKGYSALPKEFQEKVPQELRWWEKNLTGEKALSMIKEIRKLFLKRKWLTAELQASQFVLQKHWWKGQKVIRDMPKVHYNLSWVEGNHLATFILDGDPLRVSQTNAVKKTRNMRWLNFEGEIPPGKPGNPNKRIPVHVNIMDKGKVDVIEARPNFMSFKFHGTKLKGYWVAKGSDAQWLFQRSALPGQKRETFTREITQTQILEIAELSKKRENSLNDIAKKVGCSKSSVRYHLVRLGLK